MEIDEEQIEENCQEMLSYDSMREVLQEGIRKARGSKRLYLKQVLEVLDLSCDMVKNSYNMDARAERIYEILS